MLLRFIGENHSLGLRQGTVYTVAIEYGTGPFRITAPVVCPYSSDEAFWTNWEIPDARDWLQKRKDQIREVRDEAWKEGYQACYNGQQRHSPYSKKEGASK